MTEHELYPIPTAGQLAAWTMRNSASQFDVSQVKQWLEENSSAIEAHMERAMRSIIQTNPAEPN